MDSYLALIRGINVGGRNALPMRELVEVLEGLGCDGVRTYIQSGNVVFRSTASAAQLSEAIAAGIALRRAFEPRVLVWRRAAFEQAVEQNPFPDAESDPRTLHLGFLESPPSSPDLARIESLKSPGEQFALAGQAFYVLAPNGLGRSRLAAQSEEALGVPMTMRNWRTVCRLRAMLEAEHA